MSLKILIKCENTVKMTENVITSLVCVIHVVFEHFKVLLEFNVFQNIFT